MTCRMRSEKGFLRACDAACANLVLSFTVDKLMDEMRASLIAHERYTGRPLAFLCICSLRTNFSTRTEAKKKHKEAP